MKWFGKAYGAAYEGDIPHAETPVGGECGWCRETILEADSGVLVPLVADDGIAEVPYHYECHLRGIVGGINHQRGECICCGGTLPPDPPQHTRRQAAVEAVFYWQLNDTLRRFKAVIRSAMDAIDETHTES